MVNVVASAACAWRVDRSRADWGELSCLRIRHVDGAAEFGAVEPEVGAPLEDRGRVGGHLDLGDEIHVVLARRGLESADVGPGVRLGGGQPRMTLADQAEALWSLKCNCSVFSRRYDISRMVRTMKSGE